MARSENKGSGKNVEDRYKAKDKKKGKRKTGERNVGKEKKKRETKNGRVKWRREDIDLKRNAIYKEGKLKERGGKMNKYL